MPASEERINKLLDFPYGSYLMLRLEYVRICEDEIEAMIMRIIESYMETERKRLYQVYLNDAKNPPPSDEVVEITKDVWVPISHRKFMYDLYGIVKSENTLKRAINNLVKKKLIFMRHDTKKKYVPPEYQLNTTLIAEEFKKLLTLGSGYQKLMVSKSDTIKNSYHQNLTPSGGQKLIPSGGLMVSISDTNSRFSNYGNNNTVEENNGASDDADLTPTFFENEISSQDLSQASEQLSTEGVDNSSSTVGNAPNPGGIATDPGTMQPPLQQVNTNYPIADGATNNEGATNARNSNSVAIHQPSMDRATTHSGLSHQERDKALVRGDGSNDPSVPGGVSHSQQPVGATTKPTEQEVPQVQPANGTTEVTQPSLIEKPAIPEMPPASMKWSAEKMVQITEFELGKYYPESRREKQKVAARKIMGLDVHITEQQYHAGYRKIKAWWNSHKGPLHVTNLAAKTERGEIRIIELIDELEFFQQTEQETKDSHPARADRTYARNTGQVVQTYSDVDRSEMSPHERRQIKTFMRDHPEAMNDFTEAYPDIAAELAAEQKGVQIA